MGDIPRRTILRMLWIIQVFASLCMNAEGIERGENGMDEGRDQRWEDSSNEHDALHEHNEHTKDGDDDVVIGCAVTNHR